MVGIVFLITSIFATIGYWANSVIAGKQERKHNPLYSSGLTRK
jgi:hypothetical protein